LSVTRYPALLKRNTGSGHNWLNGYVFGKLNRVYQERKEGEEPDVRPTVEPYGVWTGSFNFTKSSVASFENAVYIEDSKIAYAYAHEFAQIFALSEPLDWTTSWSAPEYRIGT
jgi:hypothetical protein